MTNTIMSTIKAFSSIVRLSLSKSVLLGALSLNVAFAQEASGVQTKNLELPRIQVVPIEDKQNDRQYELYVKLPEGYAEADSIQYPVLYFTDALWHVEILSSSTEFLIENVIIVGISWQKDIKEDLKKEVGEHVSRYRDYTLRESSNPERQAKYQFGQASNHLDFIRNDVIPYVETNYRTDPDSRTYFGYSASGLFGAYILLAQPSTFKNYILGSPSLRGDIPLLTELESNAALKRKGLNANLFITYGALEKELGEHAEEFITILKNRNDESLSIRNVVIDGSHQTAFPMTSVQGVTWLADLIKE